MTLNGDEYKLDAAPFVDHGSVYLPVRDIGGLLGTSVSWNASSKTVTMHYPELEVALTFGSMKAVVNGSSYPLSAPLRTGGGRIFVPLRFFSEAAGADVKWDGGSKTVSIARSDDFVKPDRWGPLWLNRSTGDLYMGRDEQSPAIRIGKLDAALQGEISFQGGSKQGGNTVLTVVDNYGESRMRHDAYALLIHDNRIIAQKKASYDGRYEQNATYYQIYDPNGWIEYTVLTDGRIVTVYDNQGKEAKTYDLPALTGVDDVYAVLAVGADYLEVRPNRTGLLTLIDLKDHSVVALADKLLTDKDLAYARENTKPYPGDSLTYGGDMGHGVLAVYYASPFGSKDAGLVRLTYERPSYEEERNAIPKPRSIGEMAAGCSPETVAMVNMSEGDLMYIPLIGENEEDRDAIGIVCGLLKKFAADGVERTYPSYSVATFFHGMEVGFKKGDGVAIHEVVGGLALGYEGGGTTTVLADPRAVRDFRALKVMPTALSVVSNPANFGDTLHFKGNNGDTGKSSPLSVSWAPIVGSYPDSDPDPSLVVYAGTSKYGRYDVNFVMPAYGRASDGTLKPIRPGRGRLIVSGSFGGMGGSTFVELAPASRLLLSVNGVPATDPALAPITVGNHVLVPVRAIAKLTGQPVDWDAKTGCILIRTKPAAVTGASKGGAELWIDGKKAAADLQPVVRNGAAYVPIRAVTAAFRLPVVWNGPSRTVNVTVASPPTTAAT